MATPSSIELQPKHRIIHAAFEENPGPDDFHKVAIPDGTTTEELHETMRNIALQVMAKKTAFHDFTLKDADVGHYMPVSINLPHDSRLILCPILVDEVSDEEEGYEEHEVEKATKDEKATASSEKATNPEEAQPLNPPKKMPLKKRRTDQRMKAHLRAIFGLKKRGHEHKSEEDNLKNMSRAMEKMSTASNVNTYLANDRTLLAWTRTALATIRTCFSFMGLKYFGQEWLVIHEVLNVAWVVLGALMFIMGCWRYLRMKEALDKGSLTKRVVDYERSLWHGLIRARPYGIVPVNILLSVVIAVVVYSVASENLYK